MSTNQLAKWRISPEVRATYSEDGAVLLDINKGLCYGLNPVAARIWVTIETSQAGITLDGIVGALETLFDVPEHKLEDDVLNYVSKLERMGLIQRSGLNHGSRPSVRGVDMLRNS